MSITRGIEILKKDPAKERPLGSRPCVSWKNRDLDMWIREYVFDKMDTTTYREGPEYYSCTIPKEQLLQMADDLVNRRFELCPDYCEYFHAHDLEDCGPRYGGFFRELADDLQDDEVLVYYDAGD